LSQSWHCLATDCKKAREGSLHPLTWAHHTRSIQALAVPTMQHKSCDGFSAVFLIKAHSEHLNWVGATKIADAKKSKFASWEVIAPTAVPIVRAVDAPKTAPLLEKTLSSATQTSLPRLLARLSCNWHKTFKWPGLNLTIVWGTTTSSRLLFQLVDALHEELNEHPTLHARTRSHLHAGPGTNVCTLLPPSALSCLHFKTKKHLTKDCQS
jgi:hypothetical protein